MTALILPLQVLDRLSDLHHSPTSALTDHGAAVGYGREADSVDDGGGDGSSFWDINLSVVYWLQQR